jgi:hypothetical protein
MDYLNDFVVLPERLLVSDFNMRGKVNQFTDARDCPKVDGVGGAIRLLNGAADWWFVHLFIVALFVFGHNARLHDSIFPVRDAAARCLTIGGSGSSTPVRTISRGLAESGQ